MNGITLAAVVLGIVGLGFFYLNRKIDNRLRTSALIEKIQHEIDEILIELNATTERNVGLVEERIRALTKLLDQADRKLGVLQREMDKQARSADLYSNVLKHQLENQRKRVDTPSEEPESERERESPKLKDRVRALRNEGLSAPQIAAKLSSPVGEVELILSLLEEKR